MNDIMSQKYKDKMWNIYEIVFVNGNRIKV